MNENFNETMVLYVVSLLNNVMLIDNVVLDYSKRDKEIVHSLRDSFNEPRKWLSYIFSQLYFTGGFKSNYFEQISLLVLDHQAVCDLSENQLLLQSKQ